MEAVPGFLGLCQVLGDIPGDMLVSVGFEKGIHVTSVPFVLIPEFPLSRRNLAGRNVCWSRHIAVGKEVLEIVVAVLCRSIQNV